MNALPVHNNLPALETGLGLSRQGEATASTMATLADPSGKFALFLIDPPAGGGQRPNLFCIDAATGATAVEPCCRNLALARQHLYEYAHRWQCVVRSGV